MIWIVFNMLIHCKHVRTLIKYGITYKRQSYIQHRRCGAERLQGKSAAGAGSRVWITMSICIRIKPCVGGTLGRHVLCVI